MLHPWLMCHIPTFCDQTKANAKRSMNIPASMKARSTDSDDNSCTAKITSILSFHLASSCLKILEKPKLAAYMRSYIQTHGLICGRVESIFWSDLIVTVQEIWKSHKLHLLNTNYLLLITSQKPTFSSWLRDWAASPILRSILSATPASSQ